jgi:phenylalanyl-tRNA synthetase beta chain
MLGELHPRIVARLELPSAPVVFEMLLDPLSAPGMPVVQDISRFPPVIRDMALVVGREVPAGDLLDRLRGLKHQVKQGAWIRNVKCFDEYRGKGLSDKEKSLAFRFILQSPETTLQDAEVEALMSQILQTMQSDFGARIRS